MQLFRSEVDLNNAERVLSRYMEPEYRMSSLQIRFQQEREEVEEITISMFFSSFLILCNDCSNRSWHAPQESVVRDEDSSELAQTQ